MLRFALILMACSFSGKILALTSSKHFCQISIQMEWINGEKRNVQFTSPLKTKEECRALARIHRKHFDPSKTKSKRVSFIWKKTSKSIPMLAKAKSKKTKALKKVKMKSRRS